MATEYKIAEDVAEKEFDRICAANRIDVDVSALDEEDLKDWLEQRGKIVLDIRRGKLVVDAEGKPVYTPATGGSLTFHPATGATVMALETYKDKGVSNQVAVMEELTRSGRGTFAKLPLADFQACRRVANLFFSVPL